MTLPKEFEVDPISEPQSATPWYLVYTKPRQEQVAVINLQQQAYEAYLPLYKVVKKTSGEKAESGESHEPMFPRYLFARASQARQSVAGIRSTRGVTTIVRFGYELAVVKPELVAAVRHAESLRNNVFDSAAPPFKQGNKVLISNGPLAGLGGVVQIVSRKRVTLLLEFLGQHQRVQVDAHQLELA
jgi:transcriptional antiterminator RfaH